MLQDDALKKALRKIGQNLDEFGSTDPSSFNQQDLDMLYSLGFSLYESGDYERSKLVFQRLVLSCPHDLSFWKGLASAHQMLKAYDDALNAWAMLSLMDDKDPIFHLHAAECLASLHQASEAKKALGACEHLLQSQEDSEEKQALLNRKSALLNALEKVSHE